jgi:hypothetical protein
MPGEQTHVGNIQEGSVLEERNWGSASSLRKLTGPFEPRNGATVWEMSRAMPRATERGSGFRGRSIAPNSVHIPGYRLAQNEASCGDCSTANGYEIAGGNWLRPSQSALGALARSPRFAGECRAPERTVRCAIGCTPRAVMPSESWPIPGSPGGCIGIARFLLRILRGAGIPTYGLQAAPSGPLT